MMMTAREVINSCIPCRVSHIYDVAEHLVYMSPYAYIPTDHEIDSTLIDMFGNREVDIMYTRGGHPVVVYSNWKMGCMMKNVRGYIVGKEKSIP